MMPMMSGNAHERHDADDERHDADGHDADDDVQDDLRDDDERHGLQMMPMDDASKDMFMECCKRMMTMMAMGMPMMMMCGGMG